MLNLSVEITCGEQELLFAGAIVCYGGRIAVMVQGAGGNISGFRAHRTKLNPIPHSTHIN